MPDERRGAEYQAVLCLARPDGSVLASVLGRCRGADRRRAAAGTGGFGYDPLFVHRGQGDAGERTMAELGPEEKDAISHRGEAFRRLVPVLAGLAGSNPEPVEGPALSLTKDPGGPTGPLQTGVLGNARV